MGTILIIEDDIGISDLLALSLTDAGFLTKRATTLKAARQLLVSEDFDGILLDLGLPDGNGIDLCRELRVANTIPLIIITARRDEIDRVLGLEFGADDYVVKPFSPREVVARLHAVLRRQNWGRESSVDMIEWGGLEIDISRRAVRVADSILSMTRTEFDLLLTLARRPGHVLSRAQLIDTVWQGAFIQDRVVDSVISRLRRKLGDQDNGEPYIRTVHGVGYSLG